MRTDRVRPSAAMLVIVSAALSGCGAQLVPTPAESSGAESSGAGSTSAGTSHKSEDPRVAEALQKLSAEDRKLAEEQKFCVVSHSSPLGSMGTPIKLDVNGQPVFICCEGCQAQALANPEETLAKVAELKAASNSEATDQTGQN